MADPTTCARHPASETRLRCARCDTPICPRCAVEAPIGLRCPDCGKTDRGGGSAATPGPGRPSPRGGGARGPGGRGADRGVRLLLPIGGLIVAYLVGLQIGQRVRAAASGNTVDVVRAVAIGGAFGSAVVAEVVIAMAGSGIVGISSSTLLRAGIAVFGAWSALR